MMQYTNYIGLMSINIYELHRFNLLPYVIHQIPQPDIDRNKVAVSYLVAESELLVYFMLSLSLLLVVIPALHCYYIVADIFLHGCILSI
jgi:hypothetical protein